MTVASRSKGSHVEHSFVSDVFASLETWYLAYTNKWPDVRVLAGLLNEDGVRELTTIDFEFLTKMRHSSLAFGLTAQERKYVSNNEGDQIQDVAPEQLQRKEISIIKWLQHYGRFDALIAPTVGDNFLSVATRATRGQTLSKTIRAESIKDNSRRKSAEQERVADGITTFTHTHTAARAHSRPYARTWFRMLTAMQCHLTDPPLFICSYTGINEKGRGRT